MTKLTKTKEEDLMTNGRRKLPSSQPRRFVQRYHRESAPRKPTQTESFDHFFHKLKSRALTIAMAVVFMTWLAGAVVDEVTSRYEAIRVKIVHLSEFRAAVPAAELSKPALSDSSASRPGLRNPKGKSEAVCSEDSP